MVLKQVFFRYSQKTPNKRIVYSTSLISLLFTSSLFIFILFLFLNQQLIGYSIQTIKTIYNTLTIIIGLDAISISFVKLREKNNAVRFAFNQIIKHFYKHFLKSIFIIYCPYAIDNGLSSSEFLKSIYSENYGVGYIFMANLIASIITFLMLLSEMIKSDMDI